jgi:Subtilase family
VDAKSPAKGGPITVANMSIEASGTDDANCGNTNGDPLHQAICRVVADGVTVVVAAGNDTGDERFIVPAAYDEVITATALADSDGLPCGLGGATWAGSDDRFASFTNYATTPADKAHTVAAPGVDIESTLNDGTYAEMSGTSMASPHLAGAAALYIAEHPGSTPAAVLAGIKAAGEAPGVDFNGECGGTASHTDQTGKHAEVLVAIPPTIVSVIPPGSAIMPVGAQFAGSVFGVDDTNIVLRLASGGGDLPASVAYDDTTHVATLQPVSPLVPGEYYALVVAPAGSTPPTDQNGDPLPETTVPFRSAVYEQESNPWSTYSWRAVSTSSAYGGRYVTDRTPYSWATYPFTGTSVTWYTVRGPDQGKARVEIDGVVKGTYDNYRSATQYRYHRTWSLAAGTHTIRVLALGQKNANASDSFVAVDAFSVGGTLMANPSLTVSWRSQASSIASGGRVLQDGSRGANVYFHFRGTGIDWHTILDPYQGIARVYVDGAYLGEFDNYSSSSRIYSRSFRGLSDTVHDLRIVVQGTKRSTSHDTKVSVDYWHVI